MRADRLDELPADAVQGMQRGQRVLEDHRELLAAQGAHLLRARAEQLAAVEVDPARDARVPGMQTHQRQRRDRLARARLADDPERAPGAQLVADPVDRVHQAVLGGELHAQVLDAQQRIARGGFALTPCPPRMASFESHPRIEERVGDVDE